MRAAGDGETAYRDACGLCRSLPDAVRDAFLGISKDIAGTVPAHDECPAVASAPLLVMTRQSTRYPSIEFSKTTERTTASYPSST